VAVIKRKVDPSTHVMLGKDVFWLCVRPGFDGAFAMGLVLVLDQMYGDNADGDVQDADPTSKDFSF
jgi:anaerobic selenocysteine-containing dehydrogenase